MEKIKRLKETAEIEFVEKKSVFIAIAKRVNSEEEAVEMIKQRKKKYADATHNVYAYILGDGLVSRYSDDAEPQGTAGMPVLNAIRMSGITDVCVIVTRYFGGILLGAGGLVRAYSTSASMALEKGGIAIYEEYDVIECECSYSDYQKLQPILEHQNVKLDTTEFLENITLKFSIPSEESLTLSKKIQDTFAGRIKLNFVEKRLDCR